MCVGASVCLLYVLLVLLLRFGEGFLQRSAHSEGDSEGDRWPVAAASHCCRGVLFLSNLLIKSQVIHANFPLSLFFFLPLFQGETRGTVS